MLIKNYYIISNIICMNFTFFFVSFNTLCCYTHTMPNPSQFSTACVSFCCNFSFVLYRGRSNWLKHVCAVGSFSWSSSLSPSMPTMNSMSSRPVIGALSDPVANVSSFLRY